MNEKVKVYLEPEVDEFELYGPVTVMQTARPDVPGGYFVASDQESDKWFHREDGEKFPVHFCDEKSQFYYETDQVLDKGGPADDEDEEDDNGRRGETDDEEE
jgi:hypothetical protein